MSAQSVVADEQHSSERIVRRLDGEQQFTELERRPVAAALTQSPRVPEQSQEQRPVGDGEGVLVWGEVLGYGATW